MYVVVAHNYMWRTGHEPFCADTRTHCALPYAVLPVAACVLALCACATSGAVTSWRFIADDQLRQGMVQMMRYLHDGMGGPRWAEKMQQLDAGLRAKLEEFCR